MLVSDLHPKSPFVDKSFAPGDVILEVDGQPVNTPAEMLFRMSVAGIGHETKILALMGGKETTVAVPMIVAPETPARDTLVTGRKSALPELTLSNINPAVIATYNLPLNASGVVVENPGPVAARIGLRPGDILRSIDGSDIGATEDAKTALRNAKRSITLEIQRGTQRIVSRFRI
ncbi:MAG: PDZ domain-containing protein [Rhodobacteraceae bacterium]|nr:PDZ domain-containing protein [Paracoccaceae bacterium]